MRRKAKYGGHRAEHMLTQNVIECVYALLQPGRALRYTLVGLAVGSKSFLRCITGPAEFLKKLGC